MGKQIYQTELQCSSLSRLIQRSGSADTGDKIHTSHDIEFTHEHGQMVGYLHVRISGNDPDFLPSVSPWKKYVVRIEEI